jgi:hypothetical protein
MAEDEVIDKVDGVVKDTAGALFGILPGVLGVALTLKGIDYMTKEEDK